MVLVDTSVWVDHFRRGHAGLMKLLNDSQVVTHPLVLGELACGNLARRPTVLTWLNDLPKVESATHPEAMHLIEDARLMGRGLGLVDVHLLAACRLSGATLMTLDRRLAEAATRLHVG